MHLLYHNKRLGTKVYRIKSNDVYYVVKSFPKDLVKLYKNEISINKQLSHSHIIKFHYALFTNSHVMLFFDYAPNRDLFEYIYKHSSTFSLQEAIQLVVKPLIAAVHYLHVNDIVHMDIKPENVLFGKEMHLYLADFGLSRQLDPLQKTVALIGTTAYAAPEQLLNPSMECDLKKIDVWCMGMLLYELMHKKAPYKLYKYKSKELLLAGYKNTKLATTRNKQLDLMIYRMLQFDPIDRLDAYELLQSCTAL